MVPCQLHPLRYLPLLSLASFKSPQSLPVYFRIQVKYSSLCRFGLVLPGYQICSSPSVFLCPRFPACSNCLSALQKHPCLPSPGFPPGRYNLCFPLQGLHGTVKQPEQGVSFLPGQPFSKTK